MTQPFEGHFAEALGLNPQAMQAESLEFKPMPGTFGMFLVEWTGIKAVTANELQLAIATAQAAAAAEKRENQ